MTKERKQPGVASEPQPPEFQEEELYEEPQRITAKATIGVVVALASLVIIGAVGYVWLTPGLTFRDLLPASGTAPEEPDAGDHATKISATGNRPSAQN